MSLYHPAARLYLFLINKQEYLGHSSAVPVILLVAAPVLCCDCAQPLPEFPVPRSWGYLSVLKPTSSVFFLCLLASLALLYDIISDVF